MTVRFGTLSKTGFNSFEDSAGQVKLKIETAYNSLKLGQPFNGENPILSQRTAVIVINGCTDSGVDVLLARVIIKYQVPNNELKAGAQKLLHTPPITARNGNGPITIKWSDNDIKDSITSVINTLFTEIAWVQP